MFYCADGKAGHGRVMRNSNRRKLKPWQLYCPTFRVDHFKVNIICAEGAARHQRDSFMLGRLQDFEEVIERQVLVLKGIQGYLSNSFEQFMERGIAGKVRAEIQAVSKPANHFFAVGVLTVKKRTDDADPVLACVMTQ